ncbi:MAG: hypothetical protein ACFFA0_02020 [Promethearchaeota archaeon]
MSSNITKLNFVGDWRIVIQSRSASWNQRVIVENTANGTQILAGIAGLTLDVYGVEQNPWELRIQHNDGEHGWQNSWLKPGARVISGSSITQIIESEDITTSSSDLDYDDLVIRLEKLGMVDQPTRPFAILPSAMQVMPDGIFEATLGRYFMAVRVRNIWTEIWPVDSMVGLTQRCRQWLATGGIVVDDTWSNADQASVGQEVINGRIRVGALKNWESQLIYFKVDVTQARIGKHNIEVEVLEPVAEDLDHLNRKARSQIFISRTTYDVDQKVFISNCNQGTLTFAVKELTVDYNTFKRAIGRAREIFRGIDEGVSDNGDNLHEGPRRFGCRKAILERIRQQLRAFLEGKQVDICAIWRYLQCCCGKGGFDRDGEEDKNGDWSGKGGNGMEFFAFPTIFDYRVQYDPSFTGQYGPIPFDDPWWKVLLMIIAIILSIAAAISAAADLANRSDDVVIGTVKKSILNAFTNEADIPLPVHSTDEGSVDAAITELNGNRSLTASIFSYLDAANNEDNIIPISNLNGFINTDGKILTNDQIDNLFETLLLNPDNQAAKDAMKMYKSGARTGVTRAILARLVPIAPRRKNSDDVIYFRNQLRFKEDDEYPSLISNSGDSGSLWIQRETGAIVALNHAGLREENTATGSRIEDVMNALGIKFG